MQTALISNACPTFFKAAIATEGYASATFELARHIAALTPDDASLNEWAEELNNLAALAGDVGAVLAWFDGHMARIMAEIPEGSRQEFSAGFCRAIREYDIDIVNG